MIGRTIGGYRIVEQVGMGGMATVYKAYDASTDRYVALKTLPEQFSKDPQFVERFRREARAIAKLEHLHILPLFAYGEDEGTAYLAMRYLPAGTLSNYIRQKGQIPLDEIARILSQISGALDHAHANGVLHRDIKPSNVLIDKDTNVYLTDFGIARMVEGSADLTGDAILGTPQYMSPEQCQARKDLTPASDQYSLGVVLYEMVTGRVPFQAETPLAVIIMQINGAELPLPTELRPDLPEAAERVILKALSRDPADRYPTCEALSRAFTQAISENQPVTKASALPATRAAISSNRIDDSIEDAPTTVQGVSTPTSPSRMPLIMGGIVAVVVIIGLIALLTKPAQTAAIIPTLSPTSAQIAAAPSATVAQVAVVVPSATITTEVPTPLPTATVATATTAPSATIVPTTIAPSATTTNTSTPSLTPTVQDTDTPNPSDTPTVQPSSTAKPSATPTTQPTATSVPATATQETNGLPAIVSTLTAQGDTGAAISLLDSAIEKTPKDPQLYVLRGQAYQKNGNYDDAIANFSQALKLAPDLVDAYVSRASIYADQGNATPAIDDLTQAVKLQPNRADAYALRGVIYRNINELDKSLADYVKAVDLDPQNPQWHIDRATTQEYMGNLDGAITDLTEAIALDPQSIAAYIQRGNDQRQKDQPELAMADFMKARAINPEDASSYSAIIQNFIAVQDAGGSLKDYDLDKALEDANKALEIQSSDTSLWYLRGRIYAFRNELQAAISDFTQAIDLDNNNGDAYVGRGYAYTTTSEFDKAHEDFNKAIELNADNVSALQGRIEAYLEAVDNDKPWNDYNLDAALADAEKAVQDDTGNAVSYLLRGKVYGRLGQMDKALTDLNQTIDFAPEMAWGYLERGAVYYSNHKLAPAIVDFKKAVKLDPNDAWSYVHLGDALYDNGQKKDALAAYQNYVKLIGSDQPVDYVSQRITELEKGT